MRRPYAVLAAVLLLAVGLPASVSAQCRTPDQACAASYGREWILDPCVTDCSRFIRCVGERAARWHDPSCCPDAGSAGCCLPACMPACLRMRPGPRHLCSTKLWRCVATRLHSTCPPASREHQALVSMTQLPASP
jgi:hypothetical protein